MPVRPPCLRRGDYVGIVAPASPPKDPKVLDHSISIFEGLGFQVKLARNARKRFGFLAGTDRERAADLMGMFKTDAIRAIFCVRGGYGTARLAPLLDFDLIQAHPKIFIGYSDITFLHCALLTKANLVSFHGPMLSSDFADNKVSAQTVKSLLKTITRPNAPGSILEGASPKFISILRPGRTSGELLGGNLSVLATTLGTSYQPSFKGKILFFEDINEPPYKLDRLLTHFLNSGVLSEVAGIAVGALENCDLTGSPPKGYQQTAKDVLKDRLSSLKIPVITGLPFGHTRPNATLPQGIKAILDANKGDLIITDPAVV